MVSHDVGFGAMIGMPVALLFFAVRAQVQRGSPWLGLLLETHARS